MSLISSSYYCYYYFSFIILTSQRHCRKYIYCMRADALNLPSNCFTPSVLPRTIDSRLGNILSVFFRFIWIIRRAVPILALMRNTFWVHPALYVAALGKKKTQQVIILAKWFSEGEDAENNRNAHLVLRNEAFMACQRWPEAQCVAQAVLILPFSNGSALREAIIWLRTMVCQMQRKECVFFFFFFGFVRNWGCVPFLSGFSACVRKIQKQGHIKHNSRTKVPLQNERLAWRPQQFRACSCLDGDSDALITCGLRVCCSSAVNGIPYPNPWPLIQTLVIWPAAAWLPERQSSPSTSTGSPTFPLGHSQTPQRPIYTACPVILHVSQ